MLDFSKSLFKKRCDVVQALAGFFSFSYLEIEESLYTPAINVSKRLFEDERLNFV